MGKKENMNQLTWDSIQARRNKMTYANWMVSPKRTEELEKARRNHR
ncbi:hypothetical protein [Oscillibacter ruminantium]